MTECIVYENERVFLKIALGINWSFILEIGLLAVLVFVSGEDYRPSFVFIPVVIETTFNSSSCSFASPGSYFLIRRC